LIEVTYIMHLVIIGLHFVSWDENPDLANKTTFTAMIVEEHTTNYFRSSSIHATTYLDPG
jgi:hypothetical protein